MRNLITALLVVLLITAASASAGTVTDAFGRNVVVPDKIERLVAIGSSMSFVACLGAQDLAVGAEDIEQKKFLTKPYIYANSEMLTKLPTIGKGGPIRIPSYEMLIKLKPDVIFIVSVEKSEPELIQRKLNIPVVALSYGIPSFAPDVFYKSFRTAGKVLGRESRAEELISFTENLIEELDYRPEEPVSAYIGGISYKGMQGLESTSADFLPMQIAGIKNTADSFGRKGQIFINREYILISNPSLLFIDGNGFSIIKEKMRSDPGFFQRLVAFREGRVYLLLPDTSYFVNPEVMIANAFMMAKAAYPERYALLDPVKKADEIFTFYYGKPLYEYFKRDTGGYAKLKMSGGTLITEEINGVE
ncbi:periplasmic binding protein [Denitrovibrio acetiphilus DSM 12809]|uniref:Periplasmic binding protein n=1 Tax=Denitrovibrio acetiphilus (strain DSM 12809 / NBRC 114555 / N2460) TaxID=522772 RepID=D4H652_DENA2|nr:ABC transporter substrate-binding protein [Denitrovibrio acetiphilus]ADD67698.1 periplasmic binding protein [Denitrovibrio acetiphilus DSM 12809]